MKIGPKIILFVTAILLIALTATTILIMTQNNAYNDTVNEDRVVTARASLQEEIGDALQDVYQKARLVVEDLSLMEYDPAAGLQPGEEELARLAELAGLDALLFADDGGAILHAYNTDANAQAGVEYIPEALAGSAVNSVELDEQFQIAVVSVLPVENRGGQTLGAILGVKALTDMEMLDRLKTIHHTDFTIFAYDIRAATTIVKDGDRVVGTALVQDVADIVLLEGQQYVGYSTIVDLPYICSYEPLKSHSGDVVGIAFSGLPLVEAQKATENTLRALILLLPAIIAISLVALFIFVRTKISRPLMDISGASLKIAQGETDVDIRVRSKDELGMMADSFRKMVDALNKLLGDVRDLTTAAQNGELSRRADASGHAGDYRQIIQGVNETIDTLVTPVYGIAQTLSQMAAGNLSVRMDGDYKGEFTDLQNTINETLSRIGAYISEVGDGLDSLARGDFNIDLALEYVGDFARLKTSFNSITQSISAVLGDINTIAQQVAVGTQHVSDGAQAVSQGATEQASSIQELTVTVAQIAEQIRQTAGNAKDVDTIAKVMRKKATDGSDQMLEMQSAMDNINRSSADIGKIIKTIDEIAFQTNILALNAAVEAARAGVHGKGFAVVAEEVRNLAAKSADAVSETSGLIENAIQRTEVGTKLADDMAQSLKEIVEMVGKAGDALDQIATAASEQTVGIDQINKGLEQLSQVVQSNSATAEQSAAAAEELSSQAEMMKYQVNVFKLKDAAGELPGGANAARRLLDQ